MSVYRRVRERSAWDGFGLGTSEEKGAEFGYRLEFYGSVWCLSGSKLCCIALFIVKHWEVV